MSSIPVPALPIHIHRQKIITNRAPAWHTETRRAEASRAEQKGTEPNPIKPGRAEWSQAEAGCVKLQPNGIEPAEPGRAESRLAAPSLAEVGLAEAKQRSIFPPGLAAKECEVKAGISVGWAGGAVECTLSLSEKVFACNKLLEPEKFQEAATAWSPSGLGNNFTIFKPCPID